MSVVFALCQVDGTRISIITMKLPQYPLTTCKVRTKAMSTANDPTPAKTGRLKNIALFLASPFIGLVYAVLLPGKLFKLAMADLKSAENHKNPE